MAEEQTNNQEFEMEHINSDPNRGIINYNEEKAKRDAISKKLEEKLGVIHGTLLDANNIYGKEKGFWTMTKGLAKLNKEEISRGFDKMRGKRKSLNDLLEEQLDEFRESKANIKSRIDDSVSAISNMTTSLKNNATTSKKLAGDVKSLVEEKNKYLAEVEVLRNQVDNLKRENDNYHMDKVNLDEQIIEKEEQVSKISNELFLKESKLTALHESRDTLGILKYEAESQIPTLEKLYQVAEIRVEQIEEILPHQKRSIAVIEDVIKHNVDLEKIGKVLTAQSTVSAESNEMLEEVVSNYASTPLIDEKTKAKRLQSINKLRKDQKVSEQEMSHFTYGHQISLEDAYELLDLTPSATLDQIQDRVDLKLKNFSLDMTDDQRQEYFGSVKYAAQVLTSMYGLANQK